MCASSWTRIMHSSTGQSGWQTGDPAQPVQSSVMTASSFGLRLRLLVRSASAMGFGWVWVRQSYIGAPAPQADTALPLVLRMRLPHLPVDVGLVDHALAVEHAFPAGEEQKRGRLDVAEPRDGLGVLIDVEPDDRDRVAVTLGEAARLVDHHPIADAPRAIEVD